MLQLATGGSNPSVAAVVTQAQAIAEGSTAGEATDPGGQPRKDELVGRANTEAHVNPHRLEAPVSPWTLQAGTVIAGRLLTGRNSALSGLVTAQEDRRGVVEGKGVFIRVGPGGVRVIKK